jgi:hypothetical protein
MLAGSRLIVAVAILVGRDNWHDTTARDDEKHLKSEWHGDGSADCFGPKGLVNQLPATSYQPLATSHQPLATSHQPPATSCSSIAGCILFNFIFTTRLFSGFLSGEAVYGYHMRLVLLYKFERISQYLRLSV